MDNNQLTHHGIKGMKWGVRRTPEQLGYKTTPKKRKKTGNVFTRAKIKRQRIKNLEKAREAKKTKEEYEAEKKKAIESGTAADVLKYKGKLSNQELSTAVNRLNMEAQLSQLNSRTVKTGMDKAESIMNKIDRTRGMAEKGIAAYNTFAKVFNSLNSNEIPTLDGNYKDRKEAREEKARKKAEEQKAKAIKKLVESGTPQEIAENFGKMSVNDLSSAVNRFSYEDKIRKRIDKLNEEASKVTDKTEKKSKASVPTAVRNASERYYVTVGKEIIDEFVKGMR